MCLPQCVVVVSVWARFRCMDDSFADTCRSVLESIANASSYQETIALAVALGGATLQWSGVPGETSSFWGPFGLLQSIWSAVAAFQTYGAHVGQSLPRSQSPSS